MKFKILVAVFCLTSVLVGCADPVSELETSGDSVITESGDILIIEIEEEEDNNENLKPEDGEIEDESEEEESGLEDQNEENAATQRSMDWDSEDSEILLRIAMAEAEGEGVTGKALVMMVVINRVWNDSFPNSIEGVVFQSGQFTSVNSGGRYYTRTPDAECYEALGLVLGGWDESQGALYFESCTGSSWHERNLEFLFEYGNHKFYK